MLSSNLKLYTFNFDKKQLRKFFFGCQSSECLGALKKQKQNVQSSTIKRYWTTMFKWKFLRFGFKFQYKTGNCNKHRMKKREGKEKRKGKQTWKKASLIWLLAFVRWRSESSASDERYCEVSSFTFRWMCTESFASSSLLLLSTASASKRSLLLLLLLHYFIFFLERGDFMLPV